MNRTIRKSLLAIGIAALAVPAIYARTQTLLPNQGHVSAPMLMLVDGTQPPAPPVPMHPPAAYALAMDGTQPPAPPVPMHPPSFTSAKDGTQPPAPPVPMHPPIA